MICDAPRKEQPSPFDALLLLAIRMVRLQISRYLVLSKFKLESRIPHQEIFGT